MHQRGSHVLLLASVAAVLAGCTNTKQFADLGFRPPAGDYKLVVMRPDVHVGSLTTGGLFEQREEWTEAARHNLIAALKAQQAGRGGHTLIAATRVEAGGDPAAVADLDRLHEAVGGSIKLHKYLGANLPTKKDRFDWTLGEDAVAYGHATGYDYALFLYAQDSFASGGRVALQVLGMAGCIVGACVAVSGGQQAAYASLIDLKTGRVVWFNALASSAGDIRTPEGAAKMIDKLLDQMKPGKVAKSGA